MPSSIDLNQMPPCRNQEKMVLSRIVNDVVEAIQNAAENGYPTDNMSDRELAEDLWTKAGFVEDYSVDFLEMAVVQARKILPITYFVFLDYGFSSEDMLIATSDLEEAEQVFLDHENLNRRVEIAYFLPDGEYRVEVSNGGPTP